MKEEKEEKEEKGEREGKINKKPRALYHTSKKIDFLSATLLARMGT